MERTGVLRLLATCDTHAHVRGFDYIRDRPNPGIGLSRIATLIEDARRDHAGPCLLLDAGDTLQGGLMGDMLAAQPDMRAHPAIEAMNALGYSSAAPGNHDFDFGLDFLKRATRGADFPFLCCNVLARRGAVPSEDELLFQPWHIVPISSGDRVLRLGLIGFAPPVASPPSRNGRPATVESRPMLEAAQYHVPCLKAAGADLIIAIAHTGIGGTTSLSDDDAAGVPLAGIDEIDALILGHMHLVFPGPDHPESLHVDPERGTIHGKPAVMAGQSGSHLAVMDLEIDGTNGWRIKGHRSRCVPITNGATTAPIAEDTRILDLTKDVHKETRAFARRPVATLGQRLTSHWSLITNDAYLTCLSEALQRGVRARAGALLNSGLPLISAVCPFRTGGRGGPLNFTDVPAGPIGMGHLADLYAFSNVPILLRLGAMDLRRWMEQATSVYSLLRPDRHGPLFRSDVPGFQFDAFHGLTYEINLAVPARGGRVRDLRHSGRLVEDSDEFIVATTFHRARSLIGRLGLRPRAAEPLEGIDMRDLLLEHLTAIDGQSVVARPKTVWRLIGPPGARAWFDGAPQMEQAPLLDGIRISHEGPTDAGFTRMRLNF